MRTSSLILPFLLGIVIIMTALPIPIQHPTAGGTIIVDDDGGADYKSIQKAIDDANDGDVIHVNEGTYKQRISIDKSVTIIGNGSANTTINGGGAGNVVTIKTAGVTITGFLIISSGSEWTDAGIRVDANGARIFDVNGTKHENGNYIDEDCVNTRVWNTTCTNNNRHGIYLEAESGKCNITGNLLTYNDQDGIHLSYSDENEIFDNNCSNNDRSGIYQQYSHKNHFGNNSCNDNMLDGLQMFFCSDIQVINNTFNNNRYGIYLRYDSDDAKESSDNIIENNTFSGNNKEIKEEIDDLIGFFKACLVIIVIVVAIVAFTSLLMRSGSGKKLPGVTISDHDDEGHEDPSGDTGEESEETMVERDGQEDDVQDGVDGSGENGVVSEDEGSSIAAAGENGVGGNGENEETGKRNDEGKIALQDDIPEPAGGTGGEEIGIRDRNDESPEDQVVDPAEDKEPGSPIEVEETLEGIGAEEPHDIEKTNEEKSVKTESAGIQQEPKPQLIIEDIDRPTDHNNGPQEKSD